MPVVRAGAARIWDLWNKLGASRPDLPLGSQKVGAFMWPGQSGPKLSLITFAPKALYVFLEHFAAQSHVCFWGAMP